MTKLRRRLGAGDAEQPPQADPEHAAAYVGRLDRLMETPAERAVDQPKRRKRRKGTTG
jgi:hypothetical protein